MHILLFILIFIIAIIFFGLSIIGFLLRSIFGIGHRMSSSTQRPHTASGRTTAGDQDYGQNTRNAADNREESYSGNVSGRKHKKIFTQDDGEYVDFEEIKE